MFLAYIFFASCTVSSAWCAEKNNAIKVAARPNPLLEQKTEELYSALLRGAHEQAITIINQCPEVVHGVKKPDGTSFWDMPEKKALDAYAAERLKNFLCIATAMLAHKELPSYQRRLPKSIEKK